MCMRLPNIGSQYIGTFYDAKGEAFDGAKTYKLVLPKDIPAGKFWSVTLYDNQTRSITGFRPILIRAGLCYSDLTARLLRSSTNHGGQAKLRRPNDGGGHSQFQYCCRTRCRRFGLQLDRSNFNLATCTWKSHRC